MREIKFEYICIENKKVIHKQVLTLKEIGERDDLDYSSLNKNQKVIVREFTGLKDKNGKEIFEGDILDCIYLFDGCKKHKLKVIWQEDSGRFWLRNIGECHQPNVTKTMFDMTRSKVIGNKFENPELLKGGGS